MNVRLFFFTAVFIFGISGCAREPINSFPQNTGRQFSTNTEEVVLTQETGVKPSTTFTPTTYSIVRSTATITPTTQSKLGVTLLEKDCYPLLDQNHNIEPHVLKVLLNGSYFNNPNIIFGPNKKSVVLSDPYQTGLNFIQVSPNEMYIAIKKTSDTGGREELQILDSNAKLLASFPWEDNWREIAGWLNDQQVIISNKVDDLSSDNSLLLNVFTKEKKLILSSIFPSVRPAGDLSSYVTWRGYAFTGIYFHPSLKYVVYPSYRKNVSFTLSKIPEDFQYEQTKSYGVAHIEGDIGNYPTWSPDGSRIAVISKPQNLSAGEMDQKELFIMDLEGNLEQLTDLNPNEFLISISELSWSPNGEKIAFLIFKIKGKRSVGLTCPCQIKSS